MSYLLFGFVVAVAMIGLVYMSITLRAAITGGGFRTLGDLFGMILIIAICVTLTVWLGPIAWVGVGL